MNVTLIIGGRDFAPRLASYDVRKEISYSDVILTMDQVEHIGRQYTRYVITFSMFPYSDATANADYAALKYSPILQVTFSDASFSEGYATKQMRVDSDLNSVFGLVSVDGNRYYKGGEIVLRALEVE